MMSDPIVRVQADMSDAVVRIEVANQGKDGYTPKRGVDYWTEEDVQEIHDYVDEQIGTGSGAVNSVNGKTGAVVLAPEDIGAQPKGDYALKEEVPQIDDAAVSAESTWSSKNTVDKFLPEFSESGAAVECHPFPLCPLDVSTTFGPAQAGSGEPYPAGGGRNLLPINVTTKTVNGVTFTVNADGSIRAKGTATGGKAMFELGVELSALMDIGQTFTVSGCPDVDGCGFHCYYADNSNKAAFNTGIAYGLTATAVLEGKTKYPYIQVASEKTVDTVFYPQIELGSTASEFAPYSNIRPISGYDKLELTLADKTENKNTYTVHLGDTVYGGAYDWSKGELMAEWKMMPLDGTEVWSVNLSNQNGSPNRFYLTLTGYEVGNHQVIADRYKTVKWSAHGSNVNSVVLYRDAAWEYTRLSIASDLNEAEFKAYLAAQYAAGTPVQIAYKLAEPITIQLAPSEIMPLDGTNVLISNPGDTTVSGKLDPIYLHEQNKAAAAKLMDMETRLRALESAAVNNA